MTQRLISSRSFLGLRQIVFRADARQNYEQAIFSQLQRRWIQATSPLSDDAKKKAAEARKAAKRAAKDKLATEQADKEESKEKTKQEEDEVVEGKPAASASASASASAGAEAGASETPKPEDAEDDVPSWENPLHWKEFNPETNKVFEEDFAEGEEMPVVPLPPISEDPNAILADPHLHELTEEIVNLTMLEMNELVKKLQDHFGLDDTMLAGGAMAAGAGAGGSAEGAAEAAPAEEKTTFDLKLEGFDAKAKIKVIKEVRAIAGLGLKEAKELVEGAPKIIKKDLKKEEAEELKAKLEAVGATIEIS
jgi:large subunit ribosomal protein L7/L12